VAFVLMQIGAIGLVMTFPEIAPWLPRLLMGW
jgi:hypothetical protein